jgi:hypothetical protein
MNKQSHLLNRMNHPYGLSNRHLLLVMLPPRPPGADCDLTSDWTLQHCQYQRVRVWQPSSGPTVPIKTMEFSTSGHARASTSYLRALVRPVHVGLCNGSYTFILHALWVLRVTISTSRGLRSRTLYSRK